MLELSESDRKALREAIQSAYPSLDDLALFLDEALNKNLAVEAGTGRLNIVTSNLIKRAIARGYIEELILKIASDVPDRKDIQRLCAQVLRQHLVLNPSEPLVDERSLALEPDAWDIDIQSTELELFLPRQFSFEADVGILRQGLDLSASVCKITFADRSPGESGTGVLVGPDLVLTNYHVLSLEPEADLNAKASTAQFEFGYVSVPEGETQKTQCLQASSATPVVAASPIDALDYALIRLALSAEFQVKPVPLNTTAQLLVPRSPLNLLQHPAGEALKVSLSNNGVVKTNQDRGLVLYVNPTQRGSSGSPCFDDQWRLVALHHKHLQTSFGSVREGILLSAIQRHLQSVASVSL